MTFPEPVVSRFGFISWQLSTEGATTLIVISSFRLHSLHGDQSEIIILPDILVYWYYPKAPPRGGGWLVPWNSIIFYFQTLYTELAPVLLFDGWHWFEYASC